MKLSKALRVAFDSSSEDVKNLMLTFRTNDVDMHVERLVDGLVDSSNNLCVSDPNSDSVSS